MNDWRSVLFTNEACFTRSTRQSPKCGSQPGERNVSTHFSLRVKFGAGRMMVWDVISLEARIDLFRESTLKSV